MVFYNPWSAFKGRTAGVTPSMPTFGAKVKAFVM
jgi:hypothetical protein